MQEGYPIEEYLTKEVFKEPEKPMIISRLDDFLSSRYFWASVLVLSLIISFFLGRFSVESKKETVKIINNEKLDQGASVISNTDLVNSVDNIVLPKSEKSQSVVASKNGTKYHYPWCTGAKQITPQNLLTFDSIEEARAKGYTPALNCKGLK